MRCGCNLRFCFLFFSFLFFSFFFSFLSLSDLDKKHPLQSHSDKLVVTTSHRPLRLDHRQEGRENRERNHPGGKKQRRNSLGEGGVRMGRFGLVWFGVFGFVFVFACFCIFGFNKKNK